MDRSLLAPVTMWIFLLCYSSWFLFRTNPSSKENLPAVILANALLSTCAPTLYLLADRYLPALSVGGLIFLSTSGFLGVCLVNMVCYSSDCLTLSIFGHLLIIFGLGLSCLLTLCRSSPSTQDLILS